MAQRPRVDSLSTFEDFWSQKREEVDEEGDIDVGEPGDAILPPDPAPHAPVHRRSRVPSEEDLSHAEDLLSVSHGERDARGGGDSGHNSPSLTPALTARRLMGDASPIINPLGGAGRIPSHEDLKGLGSVDLRSGSFGGEHNFLEMFEHDRRPSISELPNFLATGPPPPNTGMFPPGGPSLGFLNMAPPESARLDNRHLDLLNIAASEHLLSLETGRLRSDSLSSDISVGSGRSSARLRERLASISSLVSEPYMYESPLRSRANSLGFDYTNHHGMDLGQLGVSHVDGTTNDGGFDSEDMYLMHPGLHDGGEGHGEELFEPVAPKVTGGTRSRPAKPAAKAKSPVVTPKKKQSPLTIRVPAPMLGAPTELLIQEAPPSGKRKRKPSAVVSGDDDYPSYATKRNTPVSRRAKASASAALGAAMEYAEQVGVAANEYEPALPTAEAEDVHVDVDVEDKQPPPAGPSPASRPRPKPKIHRGVKEGATMRGLPNIAELVKTPGMIGLLTPEERKKRIERFMEKRRRRVWKKKINYKCRQKLADGRLRIKGRFVSRGELERMIKDGMVNVSLIPGGATALLNGDIDLATFDLAAVLEGATVVPHVIRPSLPLPSSGPANYADPFGFQFPGEGRGMGAAAQRPPPPRPAPHVGRPPSKPPQSTTTGLVYSAGAGYLPIGPPRPNMNGASPFIPGIARGYPIKPEMRPRPVPAPSLPLPVHSAVAPQLPIKPEDQRGIAGGGFKKVLGIPGSGMQSMRVGGPAPVQSAAVQGSPAVGGGVGIGGEGGGMVEVEGTAAVQTPPLKPSAGFIIRSVPSPIDPSAILTNAPANPSPPVTAPA